VSQENARGEVSYRVSGGAEERRRQIFKAKKFPWRGDRLDSAGGPTHVRKKETDSPSVSATKGRGRKTGERGRSIIVHRKKEKKTPKLGSEGNNPRKQPRANESPFSWTKIDPGKPGRKDIRSSL